MSYVQGRRPTLSLYAVNVAQKGIEPPKSYFCAGHLQCPELTTCSTTPILILYIFENANLYELVTVPITSGSTRNRTESYSFSDYRADLMYTSEPIASK